jgi:hypothetical protein
MPIRPSTRSGEKDLADAVGLQSYVKGRTVDAIKEAIHQLPEPDRRELADWFEEQFLLRRALRRSNEKSDWPCTVDRGEGIPGDQSRVRPTIKASLAVSTEAALVTTTLLPLQPTTISLI